MRFLVPPKFTPYLPAKRPLGSIRPPETALTWTRCTVYHSGDQFFPRLFAELEEAQRIVCLEYYIFANDGLGRRMVDILTKLSRRGVSVKLIVDGIGSPDFSTFQTELEQAGVATKVFHPLPWNLKNFRGHSWFELFRSLWSMNRRDHRKITIIDRRVGWVGSMNITDDHVTVPGRPPAWRDVGVRVEGPAVQLIQFAFDDVWVGLRKNIFKAMVTWPRALARQTALVRMNTTWLLRRGFHTELILRIAKASQRIWITSAYFIPDRKFMKALRRAARNGADVRILVPSNSDVPIVRWISWAFFDSLLKTGVRIYEYGPRVLHAKSIIIDKWAQVGSSNLNHRSLLHDLELDVVLTNPHAIHSLEAHFLKDVEQAQLVDWQTWKSNSLWKRFVGKVLFAIRYWF